MPYNPRIVKDNVKRDSRMKTTHQHWKFPSTLLTRNLSTTLFRIMKCPFQQPKLTRELAGKQIRLQEIPKQEDKNRKKSNCTAISRYNLKELQIKQHCLRRGHLMRETE